MEPVLPTEDFNGDGVIDENDVDPKADWYSEWQKYSNPYIMYEPAPLLRAQYAICVFTSTGEEAGMVRLA